MTTVNSSLAPEQSANPKHYLCEGVELSLTSLAVLTEVTVQTTTRRAKYKTEPYLVDTKGKQTNPVRGT